MVEILRVTRRGVQRGCIEIDARHVATMTMTTVTTTVVGVEADRDETEVAVTVAVASVPPNGEIQRL